MRRALALARRRLLWALPVILRVMVVWQLALPAVSKFVAYEQRVRDFEHHGIPDPEHWVLIVGFIETTAVLAMILGAAARLAAVAMVPVMLVAIAAAGLESGNAMVLAGCLGIAIIGSGPFSLWNPKPNPPWGQSRRH